MIKSKKRLALKNTKRKKILKIIARGCKWGRMSVSIALPVKNHQADVEGMHFGTLAR